MTRIIVAAGTEAGFRRLLAALGLAEHDSRVSRVRRVGDAALYAGSEEAVVITAAGRETGGEILSRHDEDSFCDGRDAAVAVRAMIRYNYMTSDTARDYAAKVHLSLTYLCRVFRREHGRSIGAVIMATRMEKAADILMTSGLMVKETAALVGFSNFSYFCKKFREHYGMTPAEYRRRSRVGKISGGDTDDRR